MNDKEFFHIKNTMLCIVNQEIDEPIVGMSVTLDGQQVALYSNPSGDTATLIVMPKEMFEAFLSIVEQTKTLYYTGGIGSASDVAH